MRILFCGDRRWSDPAPILHAFDRLQPTLVIEGECEGADLLSRREAELRGIPVLPFPAQWDKYGRAAGPVRNRQMLEEGKPDLVVAFHSNLENSKGTADMVKQARKAGVPVEVVA